MTDKEKFVILEQEISRLRDLYKGKPLMSWEGKFISDLESLKRYYNNLWC